MSRNEQLLNNYAACEKIIAKDTTTASEKAAGWRQQTVLLLELTRDETITTQYNLMQHHYNKLETQPREEYFQQRAKRVEHLLKDYQKPGSSSMPADEYPRLNDMDCEANCRGFYESCEENEVAVEELLSLRRTTKSVEGALAAAQPAVLLEASDTQSRSGKTIQNFLRPPKETNKLPAQARAISGDASNGRKANSSRSNQIAMVNYFRTALEEMDIRNKKKYNLQTADLPTTSVASTAATSNATPLFSYSSTKKSLGARRSVRSSFVPPVDQNVGGGSGNTPPEEAEPIDERLVNIDPKMVDLIRSEIMHKYQPVEWTDIAGLEYAKSIIKEAVVYPLLRPDIFTGLRRPPRGILLFGPPGTGKTLIGKCIASQSKSTFFSISATSLTSKWIGEGEKMVRALFAVASVHQPSVVFIDEIDSLLSQRSETEHESSRRLKNEFLIQLDGAATSGDDRMLIVGATNRPQEIDEAARRRLVRRLYIPLPELEARIQIITNLLSTVPNNLSSSEVQEVGELTDGYSGADVDTLCREASMEPIRSIPAEQMLSFNVDKVRPVLVEDFKLALRNVRPSVSKSDLQQYTQWNSLFGSMR